MDKVNLSIAEATRISRAALTRAGALEINSDITARALVRAEIDGQKGHGLSRIPSYAAQVSTGKVNGRAAPIIEDVKPGLFRVNAGFGFAYPAIKAAMPELTKRVKELGLAAAAIYHSHHFGVAGHHCEDLAAQGFVAFVYGNTPAAMAPFGATEKVLGTNPIAFAAPTDREPLVIDFALSTAARGKIMAARQAKQKIPEGWALGPDGRPTTDAETALLGSLLPVGGVKGSALALLVEVMSGCLAGVALGYQASSLFDGEGLPPNLSQVLIAIDANPLSEGGFFERVRELAAIYERVEGARFPGQSRLQNRQMAAAEGLHIPAPLMAEIEKLAG